MREGKFRPETLEEKPKNPEKKQFTDKEWIDAYKEMYREFDIKIDISKIEIPEATKERPDLMIIPKKLSNEELFEKIKKLIPTAKRQDDLDEQIKRSVQSNEDESYAIRLKFQQEIPEEFFDKRNVEKVRKYRLDQNCMTLKERLILELMYYRQTGKYLDKKSATLCAGSIERNGCVPVVFPGCEVVSLSYKNLYPGIGPRYVTRKLKKR